MTPMNEIDQKAAEWAAKTDITQASESEAAALEAWLAEDARHLGAYLRMRAVLERVGKGGAAAFAVPTSQSASVLAFKPRRGRRALVGSIAAGLALVLGIGVAWQANRFDAAYSTALGKTEKERLPDGSVITLNSATTVEVHYRLFRRDIVLRRGEALFDVAKSKVRPFVVASGEMQVRAVGTSFSVSAINGRPMRVLVRDGVVSIQANGHQAPIRLAAGHFAEVSGEQFVVVAVSAEQIANALAWREGLVVFRRQTLAAAAKEFERYSPIRIEITDPAVAAKTVTGTYVTTDPIGFAKAVSIAWHLKIEQRRDTVRVSHQKN